MKKILYKFLIITFLLIGKLSIAQDCAIVELAKDFSRNSELKTLLQEDNFFKAWRILFSENPSLRSSVPEIKLVAENIEQIEKLGGYKKWIATLSREEREVPKLFFDTQKKFEETVNTSQLPKHLRALVYQYYKKANSENKPHLWKRIEEIFSEYNINRKFPPCNGGYNIRDKVNISEFTKYDRYCNPIGNWDGTSAPILGGSFTSPIVNGKPFDFSSRALNLSENEYKIYFEIEVLEDTGLTGQLADVIPWFNQKGQGKQMMWNLPKDPTTNYPKTWNQLAEEGKIRITIKEVHSSDPNLLKWKGKVIGQTKKNTTFDKLIKENKVSDELKKLGWATDDINLFNNTFKETQTLENAKSWKLLKDAGRTQLIKNADVLETLTRIRANKNLKKIGATDELLAKIQGVEGVSYEQVLNNLDLFANNMAKNNVTLNDFNKVLNQLTQEVSKRDGANWIVEYLAKNSDQFKGKTIKFEEFNSTTLGGRFIDVTDETFSFNKIFYEFKSVKTVPPKDFAEQFMKDLSNAKNLSQIKWIFNGSKNPPNFKQNMLEAIDKLPLTDDLGKKLLGENSNKEFLKLRIKKDFDEIFNLGR
ncbi:hypothetical protein [Capnocytophaga sputigena]|uniref:hypothetical protein n=1 Tax=Capnocytophaga sputigena TaxID=1019 RepID=UPI0028EA8F62|nr:hypothetical protein [Capnocytophaga sputigena]